MKYADGPRVEVEVHIDAPPSRVWSLVTDIDLPARFSEEFQGAEWVGATGPQVGAWFVGRNRNERTGEWVTSAVVVACDPERAFAWAVAGPEFPSAIWRFELEPEDDGTRLRQWMRMGPARSYLNSFIEAAPDREEEIVAYRQDDLRQSMRETLEGIKAIAEGREP